MEAGKWGNWLFNTNFLGKDNQPCLQTCIMVRAARAMKCHNDNTIASGKSSKGHEVSYQQHLCKFTEATGALECAN